MTGPSLFKNLDFRHGTRAFTCLCCSASAEEPGNVDAASFFSCPHPDTVFKDCHCACADCGFNVVVNTRVDLHRIAGALHYDWRSQGKHGRTLSVALPSMGLLEGDRMESRAILMDVGHLESLTTFPLCLAFWRQANETSARHRNSLFSRATHISLCSIALDSLHCLLWGVYRKHCMTVLHSCGCMDCRHDDPRGARADVGAPLQ